MTSGDDLASVDEVRVYEDEGEEEEGKCSAENLSEDKAVLVTESEGDSKEAERLRSASEAGHLPNGASSFFPFHPAFPYTSLFYPGLSARFPALSPSLYMQCKDKLPMPAPPPAHMGYPPRLPSYGLPTSTPPPFFPFRPTDYSQWGSLPPFPPISPSMLSSRSPFFHPSSSTPPTFLPFHMPPRSPSSVKMEGGASPSSREDQLHPHNPFRNPFFFPGLRHNGLLTTDSRFFPSSLAPLRHQGSFNGMQGGDRKEAPKKPAIKKPLNAFMLFMKEMRQSVIEECTLKESAAINQILGRKWHALNRSEQAKYYEMAKREKELHAQKYPGWSARDNYALSSKKKKRRIDSVDHSSDSDSSRPNKLRYNINKTTWNPSNMGGPHTEIADSFSPLPSDYSRTNGIPLVS